jgi:hypothetical protein
VLGQCWSLAHLNLRDDQIRDEGQGRLAGVLGQCRLLAHLNLSINSIGDEGGGRLAGVLGQCGSLAHLDLSWNSVGREACGGAGAMRVACSSESWPQLDHIGRVGVLESESADTTASISCFLQSGSVSRGSF